MSEIIICKICEKEVKSWKSLSVHIRSHNISVKDYYDKYLKKDGEGICPVCGKTPRLKSINEGYFEYCSPGCVSRCEQTKKKKEEFLKSQPKEYHEKIIEKRKKTSTEKYGTDNYFKTDEFQIKREETSLKKYGTEFPQQSEEVKLKSKNTMIKNHGVAYPMYIESSKEKVFNALKQKNIPKVIKFLEALNLKLLSDYKNNETPLKIECTKCNSIYYKSYFNIQQGSHPCNKCNPTLNGVSKQEKEICDFIKNEIKDEIIENNRTLIYPKGLDVVIPNKNIAIEYNGLFWHSEENNIPKSYHLDKTEKCKEKGFRLIHIFEDEWMFKKEIVKSRLRCLIDSKNLKKIYARQCTIKQIDDKDKNSFLDENHIQGKDISKIKLGAFYNDELISVMTFSSGNISKGNIKKEDVWELNRFCSKLNYIIPGIASKLFTYFIRNFKWKEIFSYADRRWSHGLLYEKLGFSIEYVTEPNYWYIKGYQRIHRFNLRKTEKDPKDIPEWVIRLNEGYSRIWDCGNFKFKIANNNYSY